LTSWLLWVEEVVHDRDDLLALHDGDAIIDLVQGADQVKAVAGA